MSDLTPETKPVSKIPLEVRFAVTVKDLPKLKQLFKEAFGMEVQKEWQNEGGTGVVFKLETATLELLDEPQTEFVEKTEVGVAEQPSGSRLALEVKDIQARGEELAGLGGTPLSAPVTTPWGDFNWRFRVDEKLQITLYQVTD